MSLETWKAEFYPIPADKVKKKDAISHSLKKWEGLRLVNLERHGMKKYLKAIKDEEGLHLDIDGESCALCRVFYKHDVYYGECSKCPIFKAHDHDCTSEYRIWSMDEDPEPMIHLLQFTLQFTLQGKPKPSDGAGT